MIHEDSKEEQASPEPGKSEQKSRVEKDESSRRDEPKAEPDDYEDDYEQDNFE